MQVDVWQHRHEFGSSVYLMYRADDAPMAEEAEVIARHDIDFEPDKEEELEYMATETVPQIYTFRMQGVSDLANILFALRLFQAEVEAHQIPAAAYDTGHFGEDDCQPYDVLQLEELCERLNTE